MIEKININFVSQGGQYLASHRMRVQKPCELLNVGVPNIEATVENKPVTGVHVNIFNKHFDQKNNIMAASHGPDLGYYVVQDICDDWWGREHEKYYDKMCELADLVTCNTPNMQTRIYEQTGKLAAVIPDAITVQEAEPNSYSKGDLPKLLWHGHSANMHTIVKWLDLIPETMRLKVICDIPFLHYKVDFRPWSVNATNSALKKSDIVLLPTSDEPWVKSKSPNRAVDAIVAGKFVITDNYDIYGELKDFIKILDKPEDLPVVLKWWQENPDAVTDMIKKGQSYCLKKYGDEALIDAWLKAFKTLGLIKLFKNVS